MINLKQSLIMLGKIILVSVLTIVVIIVLFPRLYIMPDSDIDCSHFFAINNFWNNHIIFGKEVLWTAGPLGFLAYPMHIGSNYYIATLFHVILLLIFLFIIVYSYMKLNFSILQLLFFSVSC